MRFPVIVRPLAERDLREAQIWYEEKRPGLGDEFRHCVDGVLQILATTPLIFPTVHRDVRRAAVRDFPYILYYALRQDRVLIIGCFHVRRNPRIVLQRIKSQS